MTIRMPIALAGSLLASTAFGQAVLDLSRPGGASPAAPAAPLPPVIGPAPVGLPDAIPAVAAPPLPAGPQCGAQAARYETQKGFALWVTRKGTMTRDDPLRPLTAARLVILQVVVNGRLASAYGPDFVRLQQGFSPRDLEKDGEAKIAWADPAETLPDTLQIVADDGQVLIGPMRFIACGDAPKTKVVASPRPVPKPEPASKGRKPGAGPSGEPARERPPAAMPQGALPGLSIPKGAVD